MGEGERKEWRAVGLGRQRRGGLGCFGFGPKHEKMLIFGSLGKIELQGWSLEDFLVCGL